MQTKQLQKRNSKAENLRVLQSDDGQFFVENSEGKVLYNVVLDESETGCTCSDFAKNAKKDAGFKCKHILAAMNCISGGDIVNGRFIEKPKPKLDERWIIEIEGNRFVKYAGLLEYAHALGISKIEVEPIQLPDNNGQYAVCKATVISVDGKSFIEVGDASVNNTTSLVSKHLLRMASTRAIARALRLYTGIGLTVLEELADPNDAMGNESEGGTKPKSKKQYGSKSKTPKPTKPKNKSSQSSTPPKIPKKNKQTTPDDTDISDGNKSKGGNKKGNPENQILGKQSAIISSAQMKAIKQISLRRGLSETETQKQVFDTYGTTLQEMTQAQAASFIIHIQQSN